MNERRQLEAAAEAAATLAARKREDPLRQLVGREGPFPHGILAHQAALCASDKSEAWILGANRSAKSDGLAILGATFARLGQRDPRPCFMASGNLVLMDRSVSIWVVCLTYPVMRDTIQPKLFRSPYGAGQSHPPFIPDWEIQGYSVTEQVLKLKNGSLIAFKSCDSGREKFQGAGRDLILFDEVPDHEVYKECTLRVEGGHRLLIRGAATILPPEGVVGGIAWLYAKKVQPWLNGGKNDPHLDIFTASIRDNPYIRADEVARLEDLYPPGSLERRIRLDGELLPSIGGVVAYPAFHRHLHVQPEIGPHTIAPNYPLRLCCDFNVAPMIWTVWQRINDTWLGLDEIVLEHGNVTSMAEEFRRRYPRHAAEVYLQGDATGQKRDAQTGLSNWYVVQEVLSGYPTPVRLMVPQVNPPVIDRINAMNRQLRNHDGRIGVQVSPHMEETIADFEMVLRDPKGGIKKSHSAEEAYSRRTHATDGVGCAIAFTDPVPRAPRTRGGYQVGMIPRLSYQGGDNQVSPRRERPGARFGVWGGRRPA